MGVMMRVRASMMSVLWVDWSVVGQGSSSKRTTAGTLAWCGVEQQQRRSVVNWGIVTSREELRLQASEFVDLRTIGVIDEV